MALHLARRVGASAAARAPPLARAASTRAHVTRLEPSPSAPRESPVPVALLSSPFASAGAVEAATSVAARLAAAGHTVGLVDLPGYGRARALPSGWSLDDVIADLHDALVAALAAPPVAIAHSASAQLVLKYLESWPVAGLVAVAPLPPDPGAAVRRWLGRPPGSPAPTPGEVSHWLRGATALEDDVARWLLGAHPPVGGGDGEWGGGGGGAHARGPAPLAAAAPPAPLLAELERLAAVDVAQLGVTGGRGAPLCGFDAAGALLAALAADPVRLEPQPVPLLVVAPHADALVGPGETGQVLEAHGLDAGDPDAFVRATGAVGHASLLCGGGGGDGGHGDGDARAAWDAVVEWVTRRY